MLRPGLRHPLSAAADRGALQGVGQHLRLPCGLHRGHVPQAGRRGGPRRAARAHPVSGVRLFFDLPMLYKH